MKRIMVVAVAVVAFSCGGLTLAERRRQMDVFDTCMATEIRNAKPNQVSRKRICGCAIQATGGVPEYLVDLQEWEVDNYTGVHIDKCTVKSLY